MASTDDGAHLTRLRCSPLSRVVRLDDPRPPRLDRGAALHTSWYRRGMALLTTVFTCEVDAPDLEAFVACLALGTLEAMKSAAWPSEAGTWTLARPIFWRDLERAGLSAELLAVLQRADELDAIEVLGGRPAMEKALDEMIDVVRTRLVGASTPRWRATWLGPRASRGEGHDP